MKIQNNTAIKPAFGMRVSINSHCAYHNGCPMISKAEIKAIQARAKAIAQENDLADLWIGSVTRIRNADKNDFRESYSLQGRSVIGGKDALINLSQSWLKSESAKMMLKPYDVISKYLDTLEGNLKIMKPRK